MHFDYIVIWKFAATLVNRFSPVLTLGLHGPLPIQPGSTAVIEFRLVKLLLREPLVVAIVVL